MCSCEPGFVCYRCAGTPFDDNYRDEDAPELTAADFDELTREPALIPPQMFSSEGRDE